MDSLNKAIGLACEKGGYKWKIDCTMESILLDRLFWQALGKAEGWNENRDSISNNWNFYWHKFIDHLATGGNINSFFEELLTNE